MYEPNEDSVLPSFDIVSEVDIHPFTNAVDQASRVIATRFDFKGVDAQFQRDDLTVTLFAEADFQLTQMLDMLRAAFIKVNIDPLAMDVAEVETAGKQVKQHVSIKNGLDKVLAKTIVKKIKESKLKVQVQIQGEQVRVTGKKRDELQQIITLLKEQTFEQPLQFINFRD